jgi:hypothetical protein
VSASCLTVSNPDLLSSSETGVNSGTRSSIHKGSLEPMNVMPGRRWWCIFHKKREDLRHHTLVMDLTFSISNSGLKAVSSNASPG